MIDCTEKGDIIVFRCNWFVVHFSKITQIQGFLCSIKIVYDIYNHTIKQVTFSHKYLPAWSQQFAVA